MIKVKVRVVFDVEMNTYVLESDRLGTNYFCVVGISKNKDELIKIGEKIISGELTPDGRKTVWEKSQ